MPMGYQMINGKIEIEVEQAKVVKKIFEDYIHGKSLLSIAKQLSEMGLLNAHKKPNWNHGSVGKILKNVKYKGDYSYPVIISEDIFNQAQILREEQVLRLGRTPQKNRSQKQNPFYQKVVCGECGSYYSVYAQQSGKTVYKKKWKCMKYVHKNKVFCRNTFLKTEELEHIFIEAVNEVLNKRWMLDKPQKKQRPKMSHELREVEEEIKVLEKNGEFSSPQLAHLIYKRAELYYQGAVIDDYQNKCEIIKEALGDMKLINQCDQRLLETIIDHIKIYKEGKVEVMFINGIIIKQELDYK